MENTNQRYIKRRWMIDIYQWFMFLDSTTSNNINMALPLVKRFDAYIAYLSTNNIELQVGRFTEIHHPNITNLLILEVEDKDQNIEIQTEISKELFDSYMDILDKKMFTYRERDS